MTTKIIVAVIVVLLILSVAMYGAWWLKKDTVELTSAVISGAGTDAAPYVVTAMLPTAALATSQAMTLWGGKSLRVTASSLKSTLPISGTIKSVAAGATAGTVVLTMSSLGVPAGSAYIAAAGDTARVLLKY